MQAFWPGKENEKQCPNTCEETKLFFVIVWRWLVIGILLLRNNVLMFQKNLQTGFDVACSRGSDRKNTNVKTYKQNEP